jgi:hypothetical protein
MPDRTRAEWLEQAEWALQPVREVLLHARMGNDFKFSQAAVQLGIAYAGVCATAANAAPIAGPFGAPIQLRQPGEPLLHRDETPDAGTDDHPPRTS